MTAPQVNDSDDQLELPLVPEQPDTKTLLNAVEARIGLITVYELPSVRGYRALLSAVWGSLEPDAVPVFLDETSIIDCDPRGADAVASLAAQEHALACEVVALTDLRAAIRLYDSGGRMVVDEVGGLDEIATGDTAGSISRRANGADVDRRIA